MEILPKLHLWKIFKTIFFFVAKFCFFFLLFDFDIGLHIRKLFELYFVSCGFVYYNYLVTCNNALPLSANEIAKKATS